MTNWKNIDPDFTEELKKEWENLGFNYEACKEWVDAGLRAEDSDFCAWLRDFENKKAEHIADCKDSEKLKLREKYKDRAINCRNILIIGRTGNGKSTLANVIVSKVNNFEEIFKESGGSTSETRKISDKVFKINEVKYCVIDTPGLGDTSLSRVKTLQEIAKVYDKIKDGLSQVLFVNSGRFTPEEIETYDLLKEILFDEDVTKYTTIIRTKFDNFDNEKECEKDIWSLLEENNKAITEMIESCDKRIIHVNNPPTNISGSNSKIVEIQISLNKEIRKISRNKLLNHLMKCDEIYIPESIEILNKIEKKEKYKVFGLCQECGRNNTWYRWCQSCNAQHFRDSFQQWTSNNLEIDKFIHHYQLEAINKWAVLEWIPYEQFEDIEYLAEGGFGKVYKAEWIDKQINYWSIENNNWARDRNYPYGVVLKGLNSFQNVNSDFLREIAYYKLFKDDYDGVVKCFGISQDPKTKNYLMIIDYIKKGDLRQYLNNKKLGFYSKLKQLRAIAKGLNSIHRQGILHRDFHPGNVLISNNDVCLITDLGLSRSTKETDERGIIYGVLPYVAPEVLFQEKPYTQASDVYSFGIIAYEILSDSPPYHDIPHDMDLTLSIHSGKRPKFQDKIPKLLEDLIENCWDANPEQRPTASELYKILGDWLNQIKNKKDEEFYLQYRELEELDKTFPEETKFPKYKTHKKAVYTSRLLNFTNLFETQNSKEINDLFYSTKELNFDIEVTKQKDLVNRTKRQLSISSQINTSQGESKLVKLEKLLIGEPIKIDTNTQSENWRSIHPSFTLQLIQSWTNHDFNYQQTRDWVNIGLQPTDCDFAQWLRSSKNLTPEEVLNHYNLEQLNQEFFQWGQQSQFQTHIQQPPKK